MSTIYLEGGGDSAQLKIRCREGFRKLLAKCGFDGRMPRLVACGGRGAAFDDFLTAHRTDIAGEYVALLIDSEDPMTDTEAAWAHLKVRDGWDQPCGVGDAHVLLMTTCMETWIIVDRAALARHYGQGLQTSALPPLVNVESRTRDDVQTRLEKATSKCSNAYAKGKRSFEILGQLDPKALKPHLPSFVRTLRILDENLSSAAATNASARAIDSPPVETCIACETSNGVKSRGGDNQRQLLWIGLAATWGGKAVGGHPIATPRPNLHW